MNARQAAKQFRNEASEQQQQQQRGVTFAASTSPGSSSSTSGSNSAKYFMIFIVLALGSLFIFNHHLNDAIYEDSGGGGGGGRSPRSVLHVRGGFTTGGLEPRLPVSGAEQHTKEATGEMRKSKQHVVGRKPHAAADAAAAVSSKPLSASMKRNVAGSKRAHIECDVDVDEEMAYFKDPISTVDANFKMPFAGKIM
jgi:hypothetical protein